MLLLTARVLAGTLTVGPSGDYATPCAAIAAAQAGDLVEVDAAGDYAGDTCAWSTDALTIRGVNGRPLLDGTGATLAQQKGIFVIQAPTATIENLSFVGAAVPDQNGAGIRHQGTDLVVRDCVFRDNENGILGSPPTDYTGSVEISGSEFDHNGHGDGYSHNVYLGRYADVYVHASWSHRGNVGHLFKSRAASNRLYADRFTDEEGGAASYEIDLPEAGDAWIVGCLVEQVATTQNSAMISYGAEAAGPDASFALHVVASTLVNDHDRGTFLSVAQGAPAEVVNTLFDGPGTLSTQAETVFTTSWDASMGDPGLEDPEGYDYALAPTSPLVDAGSEPGIALVEYVYPFGEAVREMTGSAWDIGAHERVEDTPDDTTTPDGGDDSGPASADDSGGTSGKAPGCGCASGGGGGWTGTALLLGLIAGSRRSRRDAVATPRSASDEQAKRASTPKSA